MSAARKPDQTTAPADAEVVTEEPAAVEVEATPDAPAEVEAAAQETAPDESKPVDAESAAEGLALAADGRPKCAVEECPKPEFMENVGLCGGHFALFPGLRRAARRD